MQKNLCIGSVILALSGLSGCAQIRDQYVDETASYFGAEISGVKPFATNNKAGPSLGTGALLGSRITNHLAIEGAYTNLGSYTNPRTAQTTSVNALSVSLFGKTPIDLDSYHSVYGRIGYVSSNVTISNAGSNRHGDLTYGAGMEFSLTEKRDWYVRGGIDRYNTGSLSVIMPPSFVPKDHIIKLGIVLLYNF